MKYILIVLSFFILIACKDNAHAESSIQNSTNNIDIVWDGDEWMKKQKEYNEIISQCAWVISESYELFLIDCDAEFKKVVVKTISSMETMARMIRYYQDNIGQLLIKHFSKPHEAMIFIENLDITANELAYIIERLKEHRPIINDTMANI